MAIHIGNVVIERTYQVMRISNKTGNVLRVVCTGDEQACDAYLESLSDEELNKHGYVMEETTYYKYP